MRGFGFLHERRRRNDILRHLERSFEKPGGELVRDMENLEERLAALENDVQKLTKLLTSYGCNPSALIREAKRLRNDVRERLTGLRSVGSPGRGSSNPAGGVGSEKVSRGREIPASPNSTSEAKGASS